MSRHSVARDAARGTSRQADACAVRYLQALLEDDANAKQAEDEWKRKYQSTAEAVKIDVSRAPHAGTEDAPIRLVEFYDYGCPHCQLFSPILHKLVEDQQGRVVVFYMMYPLEKHPDSKSAAAAALAAAQQGKFTEM